MCGFCARGARAPRNLTTPNKPATSQKPARRRSSLAAPSQARILGKSYPHHRCAKEPIMLNKLQFYIDGKWVDPITPKTLEVIDPANEEAFARISLGSKTDVDKAVAAAKRAFPKWSRTAKDERLAL